MKLLNKINRSFIRISVPVLVVLMVPLYIAVLAVRENEINEGLHASEAWIAGTLRTGHDVQDVFPVITVKMVDRYHEPTMRDTLIFDPVENDHELFREYSAVESVKGLLYDITVRSYGIEKNNLAWMLFILLAAILVILNTALFLINRHVSRSVWKPLFRTIGQLQEFSLRSGPSLLPVETDTDEFRLLNLEIRKLMDRIVADYRNMKEFTENAAHEWQTPLSVIRSKVDLLLSSDGTTREQLLLAASIEESIDRLNRMNRGLLELARIDNGQFNEPETIDAEPLLSQLLAEFSEVFGLKSLDTHLTIESPARFKIDPELARMMFNNLINNAVKHTEAGGSIRIIIRCMEIRIANSGSHPLSGGEKIFNRFYRENQATQSTGLGLAIVKSICSASSISIGYEFENGFHHFILRLPPL